MTTTIKGVLEWASNLKANQIVTVTSVLSLLCTWIAFGWLLTSVHAFRQDIESRHEAEMRAVRDHCADERKDWADERARTHKLIDALIAERRRP
jgi:hypothetical protein